MVRKLLILVISCAYIGCAPAAKHVTAPPPGAEERPTEQQRKGGSARVLVGSGLTADAVLLGAVAAPLTSSGIAAELRAPDHGPGGCWSVEIEPRKIGAEGAPLVPAEIAAAWEASLRRGDSPQDWLLEPIDGAAELVAGRETRAPGLQVSASALSLCSTRPMPDLPARLAHPALWYLRDDDGPGRREGPGPFREQAVGSLVSSPRPGTTDPNLERIELVQDQGDPSLLLRLNEADLGLLLGSQAGRLLGAQPNRIALRRVSSQDRIYFLWVDASRRWVNDPPFRRWLGGAIDREAMLRHVFDGRGEAVYQLLGEAFGGPVWQPQDTPPFSGSSRPRIELAFRSDDPFADSIASRIRAVLELHGVRVDLRPVSQEQLTGAQLRGVTAALLVHRPRTADPLLGLMESLAGWPTVPPEAWADLRKGATEAAAKIRLGAARSVEAKLLRDARLLPLVRIHAWLAVDRDLRGVEVGVDGVLHMEGAWWSR
jgi:hypothetical protein